MKNFIKKYYKPIAAAIMFIFIFIINFDTAIRLDYFVLLIIIPIFCGCIWYGISCCISVLVCTLIYNYLSSKTTYPINLSLTTLFICIIGMILGTVLQIAIALIVKSHKKRKLKRQEQNLAE